MHVSAQAKPENDPDATKFDASDIEDFLKGAARDRGLACDAAEPEDG